MDESSLTLRLSSGGYYLLNKKYLVSVSLRVGTFFMLPMFGVCNGKRNFTHIDRSESKSYGDELYSKKAITSIEYLGHYSDKILRLRRKFEGRERWR